MYILCQAELPYSSGIAANDGVHLLDRLSSDCSIICLNCTSSAISLCNCFLLTTIFTLSGIWIMLLPCFRIRTSTSSFRDDNFFLEALMQFPIFRITTTSNDLNLYILMHTTTSYVHTTFITICYHFSSNPNELDRLLIKKSYL